MSEVTVMNQGEEEPRLELPPGFRFYPTDEEVVSHYLAPKALDPCFSCVVIADVDLNKCEPWHLPSKAKMGEKEWYFFVHKDRKYPTGMRTNRATESGYWKATGKDKEIFRTGRGAVLVGMKKTLVFYLGRAPRGEKTPWVMHEYRLEGKLPPHLPRSAKDEWAVCKVFNKDLAAKNAQMAPAGAGGMERSDSLGFIEDFFDTAELPALMDSPLVDDCFKGGASTSGAAAPDVVGYQQYQVKTEQQPAPQQQMAYGQSPYYFSLPETHGGSGVGYTHQATGDQQAATIRRYCKEEASSALPSPSLGGQSTGALAGAGADISSLMPPSRQYLELDDDLCPDMDYSNMWRQF